MIRGSVPVHIAYVKVLVRYFLKRCHRLDRFHCKRFAIFDWRGLAVNPIWCKRSQALAGIDLRGYYAVQRYRLNSLSPW